MDKRIAKRHQRKVDRARARVTTSEPDVRTPEQIQAAREASQPTGIRRATGNAPSVGGNFQNRRAPGMGSSAKTDA